MKSTKKALFMSCLSLLLCVSMLVGTTFAWFTDSVTSGVNQIIAGNLDVELYHQSKNVEKTRVTEQTNTLFKDVTLWEPGAYAYETFTVENAGSLALKYKMNLNVASANKLNGHDLSEVIKVATSDTVPASRDDAAALIGYTTLDSWAMNGTDTLYPHDAGPDKISEKEFTVVLYWEPTDHDNDYNANNGQATSDNTELKITIGVNLFATQVGHEEDSFGNDYDASTSLPADIVAKGTLMVDKEGTAAATVKGDQTITGSGMTVSYPDGVVLANHGEVYDDGTDKTTDVQQKFEYKSDTASSAMSEIVIADGKSVASYELTLPVDQNNTVPVTVTVDFTPNLSGVQVHHSGVELTETPNDNGESAVYNPAGSLTLTLKHASPIDVVYDTIACNHVYKDGVCTKCGAPDPDAPAVITTQAELDEALEAAKDGDTIFLGAGEFTTYGKTVTKGKTLTFVGQGADKTIWKYGKDSIVKGEGGSDYSFEGSNITFRNLKFEDNVSGANSYRGFVRLGSGVFENCEFSDMLTYLGPNSAVFKKCTFNTTGSAYALWIYGIKNVTFDECTMNVGNRFANCYIEGTGKGTQEIVFKDCTVNAASASKSVLNLKNSNDWNVYLLGENTVTGLNADATTGSALFQVEAGSNTNKVYVGNTKEDATLIWDNGKVG